MLTWAEYLEYEKVVRVLRPAKTSRKDGGYSDSMLYLIVENENNVKSKFAINPLPIIHRICQIKKKPNKKPSTCNGC